MSRHSLRTHGLPRVSGVVCAVLLALGVTAVACQGEDEENWVQYNADGDEVEVEVGVEETLDPVTTILHSSSGQVEIGEAEVDPGGGPIGTEHLVVVEVYDDYENSVERATVRTDSPDRGEDEYEMDPDSADEGIYTTTLVSVGEEGEVRTDTLTFRLWYDSSEEDDESEDTGG